MVDGYLSDIDITEHKSSYLRGTKIQAAGFTRLGKFQDVTNVLDKALLIAREQNQSQHLAMLLSSVAFKEMQAQTKAITELSGIFDCITHELRDLGNSYWLASHLGGLGWYYYRQGLYAEAKNASLESIALVKSLGQHLIQSLNFTNLGLIALDEANYEEAKVQLEQAITQAEEQISDFNLAVALVYYSVLKSSKNKKSEAVQILIKSLKLAIRINSVPHMLTTILAIAEFYFVCGKLNEAEECFSFTYFHPMSKDKRISERFYFQNFKDKIPESLAAKKLPDIPRFIKDKLEQLELLT